MQKKQLSILFILVGLFISGCASHRHNHKQIQKPNPTVKDHYVEHIRDAAKRGSADAQYALGYMYYYGKHVGQDPDLARHWIRKAADQGHVGAITAIEVLEQPDIHRVVHHAEDKSAHPTTHFSKKYHTHSKKSVTPSISNSYAVQLFGSVTADNARQFIVNNRLQKARLYRTERQGDDWYIVLYGNYHSHEGARRALQHLPRHIHAHGAWIRTPPKTGRLSIN